MSDLFNYDSVKKSEFDCVATGRLGTFNSIAGTVEYIMTTATLKVNADDESSKLTKHLLPIREIVDATQLDFNEILQRDLDDHRVATKLIPYLLQESNNGPSYFPPIVAVLLPYKDGRLDGEFPHGINFTDSDFASWSGEIYGDYMSREALVNPNTQKNLPLNIGRYKWNSDLTKLVVIDGQHRAMALIALYRTITSKGWEKAQHGGAKFQFYYKQRIERLFETLGDRDSSIEKLKEMEFPVTILRFPETETKPFKIARKLFVDVNKNARQPSESRIKLLSDSSLVDIFTREILNRSKGGGNSLPIYAIEYDYPGEGSSYTRPGKWSALINLNMLSLAVLRMTFGPSKYLDNMNISLGGKANWTEKNAFFRKKLDIENNIPYIISDEKGEYNRDDIKNDSFSSSVLPRLKELFWEKVGKQLSYITANIHPYKVHIDALNKLKHDWLDDDTVGALAKEAIYSGVGVYWTLRDTYQYWSEFENETPEALELSLEKPDVIKAWQSVTHREMSFNETRNKMYYATRGNEIPTNFKASVEVYNKTNTNAFYLGLMLTYMTLRQFASIKQENLEFEKLFVQIFNTGLLAKNKKGKDRLDIFSTNIESPINLISKMDTKHFVFFRYFILEILNSSPLFESLEKFSINKSTLLKLVSDARKAYFSYLKNEEVKRLDKDIAMLGKSKSDIESLAKINVAHKLNASLLYWFDYDQLVITSSDCNEISTEIENINSFDNDESE
ncbi:hypothetical protein NRZ32_04300 [Aeromonas dhakensis]|uniref:DNA sulfur modification protein DndB n=1 Tax=Aeromonas dhakensis TaxID=196024 RepID=UPI00227A14F7|nr:DNA sulfur modification protein DndB [Aeromonas dhakensis]WAG12367.1 hypothetical protein NRZ32_04300 [Aeromonas dhakensis]